VQPTVALVGARFRHIEPLPCLLIDFVLAVDVPAGREAGELVVEQLDGVVGVNGRTT
jgi:hypothetical protein